MCGLPSYLRVLKEKEHEKAGGERERGEIVRRYVVLLQGVQKHGPYQAHHSGVVRGSSLGAQVQSKREMRHHKGGATPWTVFSPPFAGTREERKIKKKWVEGGRRQRNDSSKLYDMCVMGTPWQRKMFSSCVGVVDGGISPCCVSLKQH